MTMSWNTIHTYPILFIQIDTIGCTVTTHTTSLWWLSVWTLESIYIWCPKVHGREPAVLHVYYYKTKSRGQTHAIHSNIHVWHYRKTRTCVHFFEPLCMESEPGSEFRKLYRIIDLNHKIQIAVFKILQSLALCSWISVIVVKLNLKNSVTTVTMWVNTKSESLRFQRHLES